jgi:hypothetical protein
MSTKSALLRVEKSHNQTPIIKELGRSGFDKKNGPAGGDGYQASNGSGDLMKTLYIAPNGGELSLIRCYRDNLHERLSYQWVQARLVPTGVSIKVRDNDITNEMKYHFSWRLAEPMSNEKAALFVKLYQAVAKNLDPNEVKISGHSYANGSADYGRLEISAKQKLLEECKQHFSAAEIEELSRFIEAHRDGEGVMTLRLTNLYMIEEVRSG